ncbi:MAG: sulfatase-like hydrolase/transferase [Planctomycetota bacterium]
MKAWKRVRWILGLLILDILTLTQRTQADLSASSYTNVILLLVDDLGYECLGANGSQSYRTPVVDRLAREGMRFEHAYVMPNCTPTRVALMTGKVNQRNYVHFGVLESKQKTFGHLFRDAGHATAVVGKWQLGGSLANDTPRHFGFEEHCLYHIRGVPKPQGKHQDGNSSRYINPGLAINGEGKRYGDNAYAPDLCNEFALDFISRHQDRPFFLYYPMMLTHAPFDPTPDSSDYPGKNGPARSREQHYRDMVTYNDKLIGKLMAKLEELHLSDRTLVLFLGDNGTPGGFTSKLSGDETILASKGKTTRAGMHVPLVAYWPGNIPAGRVCQDLVDVTDILPTLCAAAGVDLPSDWIVDGVSFLPQLHGQPGTPRPWIYRWFNPMMAKWNGTVEMAFDKDFKLYRTGEFYDWRVDPEEKTPLMATSLTAEAEAASKKLQAAMDQFQNQRPPEIEAIARNLAAEDAAKRPTDRSRKTRRAAQRKPGVDP